jgi:DNA end-binding protein Ku
MPVMPRSIWRGAISFGMVAIPVRLYSAAEQRSGVSLHLLCPRDGARIRNLRWCPTEQREVPWNEVVRGYEVARDEYVVLTEEDLASLPLRSAHTIDIVEFCDAGDIPSLYVDRPYLIEPEEAGRKPYALLHTALQRTGRVAVGKVALRDREHLARITCLDGALVLETLRWPQEIRDASELRLPGDAGVSDAEVEMALMLVDGLSRRFDPADFHDEYRTALEALVAAKRESGQVERPPEAEIPKVDDLMAALKASVEAVRNRRDESPAAGGEPPGEGEAAVTGRRTRAPRTPSDRAGDAPGQPRAAAGGGRRKAG